MRPLPSLLPLSPILFLQPPSNRALMISSQRRMLLRGWCKESRPPCTMHHALGRVRGAPGLQDRPRPLSPGGRAGNELRAAVFFCAASLLPAQKLLPHRDRSACRQGAPALGQISTKEIDLSLSLSARGHEVNARPCDLPPCHLKNSERDDRPRSRAYALPHVLERPSAVAAAALARPPGRARPRTFARRLTRPRPKAGSPRP